MSLIVAPLEVLTDGRLTDPERRVLFSLFSFRGKDTNTVWPSLESLAERAQIKDKTRVSKLTKALSEKGWLKKKKRGFTGGNEYTLTVPANLDSETKLVSETKLGGDTNSNLDSETKSNLDSAAKNKEQTNEQTIEQTNTMIDSAFDRFWSAGLPRVGKQKAHAAFLANLKKSKRDAESFAELLAEDIEHRLLANQFGFDRLHPTTYLNQCRWEDERPEIIPFDRIVESYHRNLPNNVPVTALSDRRREFLTYLWTQRANRDLDWFDEFFAFCASQQWLNGSHKADLEWLTDPNHYPRITENAQGAAA
ncbi:helix-turn-helix domain-containing protein [uncultured Microbulbifer sp.]|uniref:helix-turn-helix domain-containing protein n=1 Tax=uncultured Microbulbifer sp. TaxID=348147 RepID=UPI00261B5AC0|nr:helix-turn-helix domain-containing protein [uncultured Microbulbifer sp.]